MNVSDIEEPLKFVISGDKMIPTLYLVMIVELREKTKEEIDLMIENNKEFQLRYFRSNQNYLRRYWTAPILLPIRIANPIIEGYNKLLYYQYRDSQLQGMDIYGCGWCDDACRTFEFGLQEVSLGIGGNETALIENKSIMISDDTNGYDQVKTNQLNQQERKCQNLKIMKVLLGDELYSMIEYTDVQKFKGGVTTLEDNNKGWIHIQNGMNVSLQGITLTSDESIFIPAIYISDQNTTVKLEEFIIHDVTFQSKIPYSTGPHGVVQIDLAVKDIRDNGSLIIEDTSFTSCSYIENDGGGIYVILNKTFRFETKGTVIFTGCTTTKDTLEVVGGRGSAIYIYLAEESTFNFIIGEDTSFTTNEADICGEDNFIYIRNMNILNIQTHILFDITTFTNSDNAMYETKYKLIDELYHIPLIDYNLLERYIYYTNDRMYVSSKKWGGVDTEECGDVNSTCNSFEHAVLKQTTPDRTPTNLQCGQQIVYTYISVCEMHVNQPYRTEADIFILIGATTDEISEATEGGSVYFDENGEMEFSDQAKYVLKLVGTNDYAEKGRNLELMIKNCSFAQNNTLDKQRTSHCLELSHSYLCE
ncbi:MAG: hypothetical protein EZS28_006963 [Streblomastix strix]|uniref:Uncharacterized protein n=1 Tax=Streblomastix strix TaxID=222440 RepID=A0A5J4WSJ2_9EUKA|nr:MAG: hypothetical protein EZS28_006963 [Streblomastix strix]